MNLKQIKVDQANSWEYLPDIDTLFEYLARKELVELSKCCKNYRNQLEYQVLENLSLETWERNNREAYYKLKAKSKIEQVLEYLKTNLGTKLKFVKVFTLNCEVSLDFAEIFVKLLPNIKTLKLISAACEFDCWLREGLPIIFKGIVRLEDLYIYNVDPEVSYYNNESQIFPKSIKSIKIGCRIDPITDDKFTIYDTIDSSYTNLYSLTIVSNRMLQNLSTRIPSLKEAKIIMFDGLDTIKLIAFLKVNRQLRKLNTDQVQYNEEILNTVLSYQYLEHWSINFGSWEEIEANNLPPNYSIKNLEISSFVPAILTLKIVNACKSLKALDLSYYDNPEYLDWSKFERKINMLKLSYNRYTANIIKDIDALKLFNRIHIKPYIYSQDYVNKYINFKLNNYRIIPSLSKSSTIELIK